jgi:hypothetical protein
VLPKNARLLKPPLIITANNWILIPDELFDVTPPGGGWSFAEVYSHIMQAHLVHQLRLNVAHMAIVEPTKKGLTWEGRICCC